MKIIKTQLPDVKLIEINKHPDEREMRANCIITYQWNLFRKFVDSNAKPFISETETYVKRAHTLRGLYYNLPPRAGAMLVRCVRGEVYQVALDMREGSPTYRKWTSKTLSEENGLQMYIPAGYAQGFLTMTDDVILQYKLTNYVGNQFEKIINYADPLLGLIWPAEPEYMSAQTKFAQGIEQVEHEKALKLIEEFELASMEEAAEEQDENELAAEEELEVEVVEAEEPELEPVQ